MRRFPSLLLTAVGVLALASACGGGGSAASVASLNSSGDNPDVAVVGTIHITRSELDHQISLRQKAAAVQKQTLPKAGSANYQSQVVQPILQRLVTNAQVQNIADQLGIKVSDSDVKKQLDTAVQQQFGSNQAKYQAYLKQYGLTEDDIKTQAILPSLLENKIIAKLKSQYAISDKQVQDYYNSHKSSYTSPDSRKVHYILAKNKADADAAHAAAAKGQSFAALVKRYSLDFKNNASGALTATSSPGSLEQNFQNAVFHDLQTGSVTAPVEVDASYAQQQLSGKCKPTCYFVIKADADIVKGGQQSFSQVKDQIKSTLEQTVQAQKLQKRIQQLLAAQKKITKYAAGFAPPTPAKPSTSGGAPTT
jgi:foldase protein PrsA